MPRSDTQDEATRLRKQVEVLLKEMLMLEWNLNKTREDNDIFELELERKEGIIEKLKRDLEENLLNAQKDLSNTVQKSDYDRLQDLQQETEKKLKIAEQEAAKHAKALDDTVKEHQKNEKQAREEADAQLASLRAELGGDSEKSQQELEKQMSSLHQQHSVELQKLQDRERNLKDHYEEELKKLRNDISEGHKTQQQLNVKLRQLEHKARIGEQRVQQGETQVRERYEKMLLDAERKLKDANSSHQDLLMKIRQLEAEIERLLKEEKLWKERERRLKEYYEQQALRLRFAENMSIDKELIDRLFDERITNALQQRTVPQPVPQNDSNRGKPRSRMLQHLAGVRVQNLKHSSRSRKSHHSHQQQQHSHGVIPGGKPMRVRHSYNPSEAPNASIPQSEQLPLKKGEVLMVRYPSQRRDGFVRAQTSSGEVGFVPKAFLEPADMIDTDSLHGSSTPQKKSNSRKRKTKSSHPTMQQVLGGDVRPNERVGTRAHQRHHIQNDDDEEVEVEQFEDGPIRTEELLDVDESSISLQPQLATVGMPLTTSPGRSAGATLMSRDELDYAIKSHNTEKPSKGFSKLFGSQKRSYNPR